MIRIGTSERNGTFYTQGRALKAVLERRPALGAIEVLESRAASMENANRLHASDIEFGGLELDRPRQEWRGPLPALHRSCHGGADERRPAVLHRAGRLANLVILGSAWSAGCDRAAHERDGATCPWLICRSRHELLRFFSGLSRFRGGRRGSTRWRYRCSIPMSHPQRCHDRACPTARAARAAVPARRTRSGDEGGALLSPHRDACRRNARARG